MTVLRSGEDRAPSMVVLGAPRSGTTSLATWLGDAGLGVGVKDSFFLMDDDAGLRGPTHLSTHGVDGYLDLFRRGSEPTTEVTAGYMFQRRALEFFAQWQRPPKFVVVVRDPVSRLRSVHRYFTGNLGVLPPALSFPDYVAALENGTLNVPDKTVADALRQGRYAEQLAPWVAQFGRDAITVVRFENLKSDPAEVVNMLVRLAGTTPAIDLGTYAFDSWNQSFAPGSKYMNTLTTLGRTLMPRGRLRALGGERLRRMRARSQGSVSPPLEAMDDLTTQLRAYYAEPNSRLSREFGVDISKWS